MNSQSNDIKKEVQYYLLRFDCATQMEQTIYGACHHEMSPVGQNLYSCF